MYQSSEAKQLLADRMAAEERRAEKFREKNAKKDSKFRVKLPKHDKDCVHLNIRVHSTHRAAIIQMARRANMTVAAYILHQLGFGDSTTVPTRSTQRSSQLGFTQSSPVQEDRDVETKKSVRPTQSGLAPATGSVHTRTSTARTKVFPFSGRASED